MKLILINKIILIVSFISISIGCFAQSGWMQQNSGVTSTLNSVRFINSQTGWCVGNGGVILKTTNGGSNWIIQNIFHNKNLTEIIFSSSLKGYIAGDSGLILKTTDGGFNWNNISFMTYLIDQIYFINDSIGYLNSFSNKLYKTINGGVAWDSIAINFLIKIFFINENTGWAVGLSGFGEGIFKTTNSGYNWIGQYNSTFGNVIKSIFFTDSLNGWVGSPIAIGTVSTIFRTTSGGDNWYDPFRWTGNISFDIYFINQNIGWSAGTKGLIHYTSNGGLNWIGQTPLKNNLIYRSIYFTDSLTGWCVGDSGRILKTTTGGIITNFTDLNSEISDKYFLSQNYPNPFNPNTIINYELGITNYVKLKVYDVLGNEVATLVNEKNSPGSYSVEFDGSNLPSGIYFYRLEVDGNIIDTKRMVLLK